MPYLTDFSDNGQKTIKLLSNYLGIAATNDLVTAGAAAYAAGATDQQILNVLFANSVVQGAQPKLGLNFSDTAFVTQLIQNLTGAATVTADQKATWVTKYAAELSVAGAYATRGDFAVYLYGAFHSATAPAAGTPESLVYLTLENRWEAAAAYAQQSAGATFTSMTQVATPVATVADTTASRDSAIDTVTSAASFNLAAGATAVAEGANATFTVTLGAAPSATATVAYATSYGTTGATSADHTGGSGTLTFTTTNWATPQTITVPIVADSDTPETGEAITVTLSSPTGGGSKLGSTVAATTTITDVATPVSTTTALTTGNDTIAGTSGDDTYTGIVSSVTATRTLSNNDSINGSTGTDTLTVDLQGNFSGFTSGTGGLAGVETVTLNNTSGVVRTFTATGVADVTTYNVNGSTNLASLISSAPAIVINTRPTTAVSIGWDSAATTSSGLTMTLNDVGTAGTSSTQVAVAVTAPTVTKATVTATGTNVVNLALVDAATALTTNGDGSLKITGVSAALKTVDASAATGNFVIDLAGATAVTSVKTGSGTNTITAVAGDDLAQTATVTGGSGSDTLALVGGGGVTQYTMTGVEVVSAGSLASALSFSNAKSSGITTVRGSGEMAFDATFSSMGTGDLAVNLMGAAATAKLLSSDHSGVTTATVTLNPESTATSATNVNNLTLSKSTNVQLNVASGTTYSGTITAALADSVEVTAPGALLSATISAAAAKSMVFNTTGTSTGNTVTAALVTDISVTNAGTFGFASGSTLSALETLTATSTKAFTQAAALPKFVQASLSGTGTSSAATLSGAMGSTSLTTNETITATGLAAGLTIGTVTGSGNTITINASAATGAVTVGTVTAGSTGTVSIDASGTVGAVTLGAITGKTVTVNAAGTLTGLTTASDMNVASSLTFKGSAIMANDLSTSGQIEATGTSLTAALTGGASTDAFRINLADANNTATVTVTGDLDAGTNTLYIDGSAEASSTTITISGLSNVTNSTITGGAGNDAITGGTGIDSVTGGAGNDTISTGAGADTIDGGAGNDVITGGEGADLIKGGAGADSIVLTETTSVADTVLMTGGFAAPTSTTLAGSTFASGDKVTFTSGSVDTITGFTTGTDVINYSLLGTTQASTLTLLTTIGASGFTADQIYTAYGTFSSGVFTIGTTGADTLLAYGAGTTATGKTDWVVLVGANTVAADAGTGVTAIAS